MARIVDWTQAWGELGVGVASYAPGVEPKPMRIKDRDYSKGLGHAPGNIYVVLDGLFSAFEAEVGVQAGAGEPASVTFQVFVDGEKKLDTGVMKIAHPARPIRVPLTGARDLLLVVTDAGDGISCDQANWANARLIPDPSVDVLQKPTGPGVDIGQFARVATWDPARAPYVLARDAEFPEEELFLGTDVLPSDDGAYIVSPAEGGQGCIGLQWLERRRIRRLELEFLGNEIPSPDTVRVESWSSESVLNGRLRSDSPWQGCWVRTVGGIKQRDNQLVFTPKPQRRPARRPAVWKVRWVLPGRATPWVVNRPRAYSLSRWITAELLCELERPMPGKSGEIELYNGEILQSPSSGSRLRCSWDLSQPLLLTIRFAAPRLGQREKTVLRFSLPEAAFGVAVEDIFTHGCVYAEHAGLFVTKQPASTTLSEYKAAVAGRRTMIETVRDMPDQTFQQALEKVQRPYGGPFANLPGLNANPTLISLAGDDRRLEVERNGVIHSTMSKPFDLRPEFGLGEKQDPERSLHGGWLPVPVTVVRDGKVAYRQRTFVAPYGDELLSNGAPWLHKRAIGVSELTLENPMPQASRVALKLTFAAPSQRSKTSDVKVRQTASGVIAEKDGTLLAFVHASDAVGLRLAVDGNVIAMDGDLPANAVARCTVYFPGWESSPEACPSDLHSAKLLCDLDAYWRRTMASATRIDLPDPMLKNLILASQVYCMIYAPHEKQGAQFAMCDSRYGPIEGDSNYGIIGLDLMGHDEFARRCNDYYVDHITPEGFIHTEGYTLMGTGWHLWTFARHYELTKDAEWLKTIAPDVVRACRWIMRQREKTKRRDARGNKIHQFGLMPPGVEADWCAFAYYFCLNGYFYAGLESMGRCLEDIGHPDARTFRQDAEEFRQEILRAYQRTQALSPVLPLRDGSWVPLYPSQVHCPAPTAEFFPREDANRTWCYDVEEGPHHLV
ncbi:MAG: NPCBM/NEW2 domain-containing protein, partial [Planctomycetes bacterium]|nr:NPCBM/NEW2 domain-containing protein [Planctomycetota bacterium]